MTTERSAAHPSLASADVLGQVSARRVLETFTGVPATEGNRVEVLRNGEEIFPAMLDAIRRATRTIDFTTYVYWRGGIAEEFAAALAERARSGVRVRVLLDAFGTRPMDSRLVTTLQNAGVVVKRFRPFTDWKVWRWNQRTHRRVLVCDEEVAFTGGVGIADQWVGDGRSPDSWRDTHVRIEGQAVQGIRAAFLADWHQLDSPVITNTDRFPFQDAPGTSTVQVVRAASEIGWNDMALAVAGLLLAARSRIRVTTAYMRPPEHFVDMLCAAVARGVDVDVLVPGPPCEPAHYRWAASYNYDRLLRGGVRVWEYQPSMLHAKIITVDGNVALVGTTNFDARSLAVNEQVGIIVHDANVTATLDGHFDEDLTHSTGLDIERWSQRGWRQRTGEVVAHVATFGLRGGGASRHDGLFGG